MSIFTKKNINPETRDKFTGAFLPLELFHVLTLYCLATGESKSNVLIESLGAWINKSKLNKDNLIQAVSKTAQDAFLKVSTNKPKTFLIELEKELERKGLDKEIIDKILTNIDL